MGAARYVGRVGGLAVALGVGAAILAGPGAAWADSGDSGAGASSSGESSASESSPKESATNAGPSTTTGPTATGATTTTVTTGTTKTGDFPARPKKPRHGRVADINRKPAASDKANEVDKDKTDMEIATKPVVDNAVATHSAASEPPTSVEPTAEESKPKKVVERATTSVGVVAENVPDPSAGTGADPAAGRLARHLGAKWRRRGGNCLRTRAAIRPPSTSTTVSSPAPTTERSHRRGTWS